MTHLVDLLNYLLVRHILLSTWCYHLESIRDFNKVAIDHNDLFLQLYQNQRLITLEKLKMLPISCTFWYSVVITWPPSDSHLTPISQCGACDLAGRPLPGELLLPSCGETQQARGGSKVRHWCNEILTWAVREVIDGLKVVSYFFFF